MCWASSVFVLLHICATFSKAWGDASFDFIDFLALKARVERLETKLGLPLWDGREALVMPQTESGQRKKPTESPRKGRKHPSPLNFIDGGTDALKPQIEPGKEEVHKETSRHSTFQNRRYFERPVWEHGGASWSDKKCPAAEKRPEVELFVRYAPLFEDCCDILTCVVLPFRCQGAEYVRDLWGPNRLQYPEAAATSQARHGEEGLKWLYRIPDIRRSNQSHYRDTLPPMSAFPNGPTRIPSWLRLVGELRTIYISEGDAEAVRKLRAEGVSNTEACKKSGGGRRLAILLQGEAARVVYRGKHGDLKAVKEVLENLVSQVAAPYQAKGYNVSTFVVMYDSWPTNKGSGYKEHLGPYAGRDALNVVAVSMFPFYHKIPNPLRNHVHVMLQADMLVASLQVVLEYSMARGVVYDSVLVTRHDQLIKGPLPDVPGLDPAGKFLLAFRQKAAPSYPPDYFWRDHRRVVGKLYMMDGALLPCALAAFIKPFYTRSQKWNKKRQSWVNVEPDRRLQKALFWIYDPLEQALGGDRVGFMVPSYYYVNMVKEKMPNPLVLSQKALLARASEGERCMSIKDFRNDTTGISLCCPEFSEEGCPRRRF